MAILFAILLYAICPAFLYFMQLGEPYGLALELMTIILLLLATRWAILLAGSGLIIFLPVSLLSGLAAELITLEIGLESQLGLVVNGILTVATGALCFAVMISLCKGWRDAAVAGFSLTFGALLLAIIVPMSGALAESLPLPEDWWSIVPGAVALILGIALHGLVHASAGTKALNIETGNKSDWLATIRPALSRQLLLFVGLLCGLAAIPLFDSVLAQTPARWPELWIGIVATVILSGRNGPADPLLLALPIMVLPRLLQEFEFDLPYVGMAAAILALVVATISQRGIRPGDLVKRNAKQNSAKETVTGSSSVVSN